MSRLTTQEVARRLNVKPATVYAYASRGLLSSRRSTGGRTSTFDPAEVERLAMRGRRTRADASGGAALNAPVMSSALTLIDGSRYYYRGLDALDLAEGGRSFEEVATYLWTGAFPTASAVWTCPAAMLEAGRTAQRALPATALPLDRIRITAAVASVADSL